MAGKIAIGLLAWCLFGQEAATPRFEVASVKVSSAGPGESSGVTTNLGRISAHNVTLRRCVRSAYDVQDAQIVGGPKWFDEDRYNIDAKAPGPAGEHALMAMLQTLLAERFGLTLHREKRAMPGYALVAGKGGLKAKVSEPGKSSTSSNNSAAYVRAVGCSMQHLAELLSAALHVPIADLTETPGVFDFTLEWKPEDLRAPAPDTPLGGPSIFAALQEQLGLKLQAGKIPTEVLVIDSAGKPSEN